MSKKWLLPLVGLGGIILAIIFVATASPPPPVAQPIIAPASVPFKNYIAGSGLTEPNSENIAIGTALPGIVRTVYVKVGDVVKTGAPLFVIEDREAKAQVVQAEAQLAQAEADMHNAQDQFALVAHIEDARAISKDERNQKQRAVESAKARAAASAADLLAFRTALELHTVRAPIDGVIMTMNLRLGEFAPAGAMNDPLIRMGNLKPLHIRVDIDENDAWRFRAGAAGIAYVRGNPRIQVPITFVRIEPYVRPKVSLTGASTERVDTRVLQVIYELDPKNQPIYAGQQMDVYFEAQSVDGSASPAASAGPHS